MNEEVIVDGISLLADLVAEINNVEDPSDNIGLINKFSNDTFAIRPYCWCDGENPDHEEGCDPNFECGEFTASWYKYLGRGFDSDIVTAEEWNEIMIKCLSSLRLKTK